MASNFSGTVLKGVHAYRSVDYVEIFNDGDVRCNLCGTGYMGDSQRRSHFSGGRHRLNYNALKAQQDAERARIQRSSKLLKVEAECENLYTRLGCLATTSGQANALKATLFDAILTTTLERTKIKGIIRSAYISHLRQILVLSQLQAHIIEEFGSFKGLRFNEKRIRYFYSTEWIMVKIRALPKLPIRSIIEFVDLDNYIDHLVI